MDIYMEGPGAYDRWAREQIGEKNEESQVYALLAIASAVNRLANAVERYGEKSESQG